MSHVDDGKLNALLDGELEAAEASEVRAHIAACAECTKRLEEAKRFLSEAASLLGVLELPPALSAPAPALPVRRVSKTAKEIAIDIDGATHQSPAIRVNVPETPAHGAPPARRNFDFTTLAWAAMIVLAVGVGYLANEVKHARQRPAIGEGSPVGTVASNAALETQQPSRTDRAGGPAPSGAKVAAEPRRTASAPRPAPAASSRARKPTPAVAGKSLAQVAARPARHQAAPTAGAATEIAAVTGGQGAGARSAEPAAPSAARAMDRLERVNAPAPVGGLAALQSPLAAFRRATLEEAVARLDGTIRLIDGLSAEQVEVGPGRLVPGADRSRDLVRVTYFAPGGLRLELDQQRVGAAARAVGGILSTDVGMGPGDTLTTAAPNGQMRVRWIDGAFWLSLTGNLPPDSLRRLVERVH